MATTYLQVMNKVLNRLGEAEIPTSTSELSETYHLILAAFCNDFKEEIESTCQWRKLWHTESVTVVGGTNSIAITNTTERSSHVRVNDPQYGCEFGLCYDMEDTDTPSRLTEISLQQMKHLQKTQPATGSSVMYYAIDATSGTDTQTLLVHPTPAADVDIDITMFTPQAEITVDNLDAEILIPERPLRIGLLWQMYEERGEELGPNSMFSEKRYQKALNDAVGSEMGSIGDFELIPA